MAPRPPLVRFLGTGAAGGTPGDGRSARLESSALVAGTRASILLDVTRHFPAQHARLARSLASAGPLRLVALTHAHRDASGGLPAIDRWWRRHHGASLRVVAHPGVVTILGSRYPSLASLQLTPVGPGEIVRAGEWTLRNLVVPHARDTPTVAWSVAGDGHRVVYASDVAEPTANLRRFVAGADLLVIDGATWGRRIYTHLRLDADLEHICGWQVGQIVITQIGRSVPTHLRLTRAVRRMCPRARPAFDGLTVPLRDLSSR